MVHFSKELDEANLPYYFLGDIDYAEPCFLGEVVPKWFRIHLSLIFHLRCAYYPKKCVSAHT